MSIALWEEAKNLQKHDLVRRIRMAKDDVDFWIDQCFSPDARLDADEAQRERERAEFRFKCLQREYNKRCNPECFDLIDCVNI